MSLLLPAGVFSVEKLSNARRRLLILSPNDILDEGNILDEGIFSKARKWLMVRFWKL